MKEFGFSKVTSRGFFEKASLLQKTMHHQLNINQFLKNEI
jgi:hypothetical protein